VAPDLHQQVIWAEKLKRSPFVTDKMVDSEPDSLPF